MRSPMLRKLYGSESGRMREIERRHALDICDAMDRRILGGRL